MYLLNEKAYSVHTGQSQKELFKNLALKRTNLTEKQLRNLNPQNKEDPGSVKIFQYGKIGTARVYIENGEIVYNINKHLSDYAVEQGKRARLGILEHPENTRNTKNTKCEVLEVRPDTKSSTEPRTIRSYDSLLQEGQYLELIDGNYIKSPGTDRLLPVDSGIFGKTGPVDPDTFFGEYRMKIDNKFVPVAGVWLDVTI